MAESSHPEGSRIYQQDVFQLWHTSQDVLSKGCKIVGENAETHPRSPHPASFDQLCGPGLVKERTKIFNASTEVSEPSHGKLACCLWFDTDDLKDALAVQGFKNGRRKNMGNLV